jgi:RNA polymerase sigma-54 factor
MTHILSQSLGQYQRMEQRLTPQLIQSMSILQLNSLALENRVTEELEKNFALELQEPAAHESANNRPAETETPPTTEARSFERWERLLGEYGSDDSFRFNGHGRRASGNGERDAKMDAMANAASRPESLTEYLVTQWHTLDVDPLTRQAGEVIIYSLDDDGYLRARLDDLAAQVRPPCDIAVVENALRLVQRLDPVGIAARDSQECLLLQIEALPGDNSIEKTLVRDHLHALVRNQFPAIAKATGFSVNEINEAVKAMRSTLHLHPALTVVDADSPGIVPDVIVDYADNGGFEVRLTRASNPRLHISRTAVEMLGDKNCPKEVRDFVRGHIESASALIDAIKFRRDRLLAVAQRIVERQRDFLELGPQHLKVLRMSELAEELHCDPSTISRTVAGKYLQTPRGIYPVRYFFSGGTETTEGASTSWDSVRASVQQIIREEDRRNPLNDDQIAEILCQRGIDISRRTVAKYRQQLDIPPARQRRSFEETPAS